MSSYSESQLRDLLADNLALIEPGLRLVKPEFWLKNADGVKGSIDLLAQDRHGMYVVIELKVSEQSGRKAVAQVMKYVRLLKENGRCRNEIRAIVVSTTWREMLTTISEFARTQDYDVRGYRIHVDEAGDLTVEQVQLLTEAFEQRLTPIHYQYLYCCAEDREIGWENIVQSVQEVGAKHVVGVDHDFIGNEGVVSPYSLYVAFGTVEPGELADGPGGPLEEDYQEDPIYERHRREYRAFCHMTSTVFVPRPCAFIPGNRFWGTTKSASPEKFAALERNPLWVVRQVRGTGAYKPGGLWSERDIRAALAGEKGEPGRHVTMSASTKVASKWNELRDGIRQSLTGNDEWRVLLDRVLDQLASDNDDDVNVVVSVHNPGDVIETLLFGFPDQIADYEPRIYGMAGREDSLAFEISGRLRWTGRHVPNLSDVVRRVYPSPEYWMLRDEDRYLLARFGLHYTLHISLVAPEQRVRVDDDRSILIPDQGKARVVQSISDFLECGWDQYLTFDDFVDAHRGQIHALINDYRSVIDIHQAS